MNAASSPPTTVAVGLTGEQVDEQRRLGNVNAQPRRTSRSFLGIVRSNLLTRFNAIITILATVVLIVGHPIDAIFALVMVANTVIGVVQESRAKRTLDRLKVLIAPTVTVRRDGVPATIAVDDLVTGDILELVVGDQVPVDGVVVAGAGFDVDESALTGESDAVAKTVGDEVRSGSVVVSGSAVVRATAVGDQTWIHTLVVQAKEFVLAESELRRGVDRILQVIGWIIAPLAALLVWSQIRADDDLGDSLVAAVAGVVGLVPQGLVLLVSMALAVGVIRLARHRVVMQELHAVEGLARVDVLCVDKTGTLTTGAMKLDRIEMLEPAIGESDVADALAALAAADRAPSPTLLAAAGDVVDPRWRIVARTAFSSARKWSGATFDPGGTWIVGAPEVVLTGSPGADSASTAHRLEELVEDARRVLLVARSSSTLAGDELPVDLVPAALVVIAEQLRTDAATIMRYFADQHVEVKIISGDHPRTVAAVAGRLGIPGADRFVDLRHVDLGADGADELVAAATVFGRVQPYQKRELVERLQAAGHTVAMTGDGVNDIPALKKADIGIAMDTATPATKAVSQMVLLDGRFDRLPDVVAEGRRVITNMERVSALFVTKTVYAVVFAVLIGLSGSVFPFLPRHMSLVSEVTIGIPAFALSFRSTDRPYRPGYLRRVLRFAVPAGLATAVVTLAAYWLVRSPWVDASLDEARTAATLTLLVLALWVLHLLMRPLDLFDWVVLGGMSALAAAIVVSPAGRAFYAIDWPSAPVTTVVTVYVVVVLIVLSVVTHLIRSGPS